MAQNFLLMLVLYKVRSERELMDTLPERLDRLWFLGCDLDSDIPNHSVPPKARREWHSRQIHFLVDCSRPMPAVETV